MKLPPFPLPFIHYNAASMQTLLLYMIFSDFTSIFEKNFFSSAHYYIIYNDEKCRRIYYLYKPFSEPVEKGII